MVAVYTDGCHALNIHILRAIATVDLMAIDEVDRMFLWVAVWKGWLGATMGIIPSLGQKSSRYWIQEHSLVAIVVAAEYTNDVDLGELILSCWRIKLGLCGGSELIHG